MSSLANRASTASVLPRIEGAQQTQSTATRLEITCRMKQTRTDIPLLYLQNQYY